MSKLELKKAGKTVVRVGGGVIAAARAVATVAKAIVLVADMVQKIRQARGRPGAPEDEPDRRDPHA